MNFLGIFVKQPLPGLVKTRLGNVIGNEPAAELYESFLDLIQHKFNNISASPVLYYAPDNQSAAEYFQQRGQIHYEIQPQPEGDLEERLNDFFQHGFDRGAEKVVVIGSDSPTLPGSLVEEAFEKLNQADFVVGPATDGGFYLAGFRDQFRPVFPDINWSSEEVLTQLTRNLTQQKLNFQLLSTPWYDIDTHQDLLMLRGHLAALEASQASDFQENSEYYLALSRLLDKILGTIRSE